MNNRALVLALVAISMILMIVGNMQEQDDKMDLENYCQMVELYVQSDGENGWPDYKEIYTEHCDNR